MEDVCVAMVVLSGLVILTLFFLAGYARRCQSPGAMLPVAWVVLAGSGECSVHKLYFSSAFCMLKFVPLVWSVDGVTMLCCSV